MALESSAFVSTVGCDFAAAGRTVLLKGANCYYLAFESDQKVEEVVTVSAGMGHNVLRTWAFLDKPTSEICFQFKDPVTGKIAVNDGPNGLQRLDRTIALAEKYKTRLILPLVNYWDDFGGVNQYLSWLGLVGRDSFFTEPQAKQAYRDYVEHLLMRTNTRTGRQYRDEPAILAWELMNEPRCEVRNGGNILFDWISEMSSFIRSIDPNHLVGVGDEGYFHRSFAFGNKLYNGSFGVDCERFLDIPTIDFGTCHLYPSFADCADKVEFGRRWIEEHIEAGKRAAKPMIVEEYGWKADDKSMSRDAAFATWLNQVTVSKGAGALVWMIAGRDYPDYDGYTVYG